MEKEVPDELADWQGHGPVALAAVPAVVLDAEGHAVVGRGGRPAAWAVASPARTSRRNRQESTRTGKRKPGRQRTQLAPSGAMPPPGTIMWTCGWWVIAEPQVWSTAVMPMRAPRCFGSAAIVSSASDELRNSRP